MVSHQTRVLLITDYRSLISDGAIAQLGERLLCKQEVVGSIPSGSTRPAAARPEHQNPLAPKLGRIEAWPHRISVCARFCAVSVRITASAVMRLVQKVHLFAPARVRPSGCVLSDIVKRRSLQARPG